MRGTRLAVLAFAAAMSLPSVVTADTATIETTTRIQGAVSEESLKAALRTAVRAAAAGAAAMGLHFITVDAAYVLPGAVTVRVLATDVAPPSSEGDSREEADPALPRAPDGPGPVARPRLML